ncbi:MAG: penicillin-binding protein 1C [Candidatus Sumerlaeota bacterium]|nr:penicillin-binding protein 1C [Candidatus Sumerlaeota bacterium]
MKHAESAARLRRGCPCLSVFVRLMAYSLTGFHRRLTLAGIGSVGLLALAAAALWLAVIYVPFNPGSLSSGEVSSMLFDRRGRTLRAYTGTDERWRIPIVLDEISPWIIQAAIATEDKRFYRHPGVDPIAIVRALFSNIRHGRIVSGASTISMQVAALDDPRERSVWRKLRQAFCALQLERALSKKEILELYFTNAPYGGNICGVEAAARRYLGKSAAEIPLSEAALLAGIPQSPERLRPDRNISAALRRREHVLNRMVECGMIKQADADRVRRGGQQFPVISKHDSPANAPHFCDMVHARYPRVPRLLTTLDLDIQRQAEKMLAVRLAALANRGVSNGAVVVLDNLSGDVLALAGSADYWNKTIDGQVNGALAPRSPGSALKPFIYALAFDQRRIAPATILCDVPAQYPGYIPENFDKKFHGLVPASKALAWSLNIPALDVLQRTGLQSVMQMLRDAGIATIRDPAREYGLSLAIGTCSVRLLDLANAYAMLARGGSYRPYNIIRRQTKTGNRAPDGVLADRPYSEVVEPVVPPTRICSEGASYLVARALSDPILRPPEGIAPELAGLEGVAWKTGTSSGYRDAWTFAFDRRHTVGVWAGNFDGRPSRALTGAEAAAPVALGLMKHLRGNADGPARWPECPPGMSQVVLCAESGLLPSQDCPTTCSSASPASVMAPGAQPALPICAIHKRMKIDLETSGLLCPRCMANRTWEERVFACWPVPAQAWLEKQGAAPSAPPPHYRGCLTIAQTGAPRIRSPQTGDSFIITAGRPLEAQKIALEADTSPSTSPLYWFLDGEFVRMARADDRGGPVRIAPEPGKHTIRCVDEQGRADRVSFLVEVDGENP